jgi:hypothetical protein
MPLPSGNGMFRRVPQFPGPLNQLVRKNMREILATLDFYTALILSLAVLAYRIFGPALPPEAFMAMTVLVVGAMSSYAQCLFGLDGEGGLSRYRLLPVRDGVAIITGRCVSISGGPMTLPWPCCRASARRWWRWRWGCAGGGHPRPQTRWRFSTGGGLGNGVIRLISWPRQLRESI